MRDQDDTASATGRVSAGFLNKMQKFADYVETNNQTSNRQQHELLSRLKEHEERMKAFEEAAGGTGTNPDRVDNGALWATVQAAMGALELKINTPVQPVTRMEVRAAGSWALMAVRKVPSYELFESLRAEFAEAAARYPHEYKTWEKLLTYQYSAILAATTSGANPMHQIQTVQIALDRLEVIQFGAMKGEGGAAAMSAVLDARELPPHVAEAWEKAEKTLTSSKTKTKEPTEKSGGQGRRGGRGGNKGTGYQAIGWDAWGGKGNKGESYQQPTHPSYYPPAVQHKGKKY